jgi:hypothetical protein
VYNYCRQFVYNNVIFRYAQKEKRIQDDSGIAINIQKDKKDSRQDRTNITSNITKTNMIETYREENEINEVEVTLEDKEEHEHDREAEGLEDESNIPEGYDDYGDIK